MPFLSLCRSAERRCQALRTFVVALGVAVPAVAHAAAASVPAASMPAMVGTEPAALLVCLALLLVLPMTYAFAASAKFGLATRLGNRDGLPELTGWMGRVRRAEQNLLTNLVPFGLVVALLAALDLSTGPSRAGAVLFAASRVVHALSYGLGITGVRTLGFYGGLVGTVLAAWPLITRAF